MLVILPMRLRKRYQAILLVLTFWAIVPVASYFDISWTFDSSALAPLGSRIAFLIKLGQNIAEVVMFSLGVFLGLLIGVWPRRERLKR
jgi:hypothetical protein